MSATEHIDEFLLAVNLPEDLALWLSQWATDMEMSVDAAVIKCLIAQQQRSGSPRQDSKAHGTIHKRHNPMPMGYRAKTKQSPPPDPQPA